MSWFWAFLLVGSVAYVESGSPTFSSNAVEHISAEFKTVRRTRKDFTKIEISAQPGRMVEDPSDIDTNRVTVETKAGDLEFSPNFGQISDIWNSGGGDWTVVEDQPSVRGGLLNLSHFATLQKILHILILNFAPFVINLFP